jgi:hypothetical protein
MKILQAKMFMESNYYAVNASLLIVATMNPLWQNSTLRYENAVGSFKLRHSDSQIYCNTFSLKYLKQLQLKHVNWYQD